MKSLNAKRIAAIAVSLALGVAFAGPVSFSNIPIINSAGQPVVQLVVGSQAAPSDGVVAANIAAVIGNLAFTSTPVTASVNGQSGLGCTLTSTQCTLSNQEVWLGEKGVVSASGSYTLQALIGSVLNGGSLNYNNLNWTKVLQTGSSNQYAYTEPFSGPYAITSTPTATSAWTGHGISPAVSVLSNSNGGGVSFSKFANSGYDNVVRLAQAQVPGLLANSGSYSESEYLWLSGFPVFDQASGVNNFQLLDTNGAYQVQFGNPLPLPTASNGYKRVGFSLLNENWSVYSDTPATSGTYPTSTQFITGGKLALAQSMTPVKTVYVGHNITSGPFTVVLQDLSYPNSQGVSNAGIAVYKNGVMTNQTAVVPGTIAQLNISGTPLYVSVTSTFPGLYSYQKWADMQLFSNIFNLTDGKTFGNTDWYTSLQWTSNQSAAQTQSAFDANAYLEGIVLYSNQTKSVSLSPGQSMNFISNPAVWKTTFVGDSLGAPGSGNTNYDAISMSTGSASTESYQNNGGNNANTVGHYDINTGTGLFFSAGTSLGVNTSFVTEPANLFTVSSSVPTAFQVANTGSSQAPTSSMGSVVYNLDSYKYTAYNALSTTANNIGGINGLQPGMVVTLSSLPTNDINGNYVSLTNQLTATITGYRQGQSSKSSVQASFNALNSNQIISMSGLYNNITNIQLSYALPAPGVSVTVYQSTNTANTLPGNAILMGALTYLGPRLQYSVPQYSYYEAPNALKATVQYQEESSPNVYFSMAQQIPTNTASRGVYFTYTMPEITLPSSTAPNANVIVDLTNSSTILSSPMYWVNQTNGSGNDVAYSTNSQTNGAVTIQVPQGFRTERGSMVGPITTTGLTYDMAKAVDTLQFLTGPASSNVTTNVKNYGPYGVGQATNLPNVTIAAVNATCAFAATQSSSSCTVTGASNLTATPSVSQAVTPVKLNTALTPLAVLDGNANNASTLIVVGSKYVNSVAGQIFAQNPSLDQSFGPSSVVVQAFGTNRILVAGYTANQTVQAGNQFIQDLLTAAGQ